MTTIEEAAEKLSICERDIALFHIGVKWQEERSYSEEDLEDAFKSGFTNCYNNNNLTFGEWFEKFKNK